VFQENLAARYFGGNRGPVLAATALLVAALVAIVTFYGKEAKGADLSDTS
jgi:hypothetical protein